MGGSGGYPETLHARVSKLHAKDWAALFDDGSRGETVVGTGYGQVSLKHKAVSASGIQHREIGVNLKSIKHGQKFLGQVEKINNQII